MPQIAILWEFDSEIFCSMGFLIGNTAITLLCCFITNSASKSANIPPKTMHSGLLILVLLCKTVSQ